MSTKADYSKDEWDSLLKAPMMAAMAVVAASPSGPIGVVKEMLAVGKGLLEGAEGTTNPLIAAVVADFKTGNRPATPAERPQDLAQVKAQALGACRDVTALLARKAPGEAEGSSGGCSGRRSGRPRRRRRAGCSALAAFR